MTNIVGVEHKHIIYPTNIESVTSAKVSRTLAGNASFVIVDVR